MVHELKTWPEYFKAIEDGRKNFEVRYNDRNFQVGDTLILQEYDPDKKRFTGEWERRIVSYILPGGGFGIEQGYVILGLRE